MVGAPRQRAVFATWSTGLGKAQWSAIIAFDRLKPEKKYIDWGNELASYASMTVS